jgi:NADPH oxidase
MVFIIIWTIIQFLILAFALVNYAYNAEFVSIREILGWSFLISRGCSLPLEINNAIILLPLCRSIISLLRSTPLNNIIPFDKNVSFHKATGVCIFILSWVHSISHFVNFYRLSLLPGQRSFWEFLFVSGPGWTGVIMLACITVMVFTSVQKVRRKNFELFWYTHHLFALYFFLYSFHGGFCLIKRDHKPYCSGASFYKYWTLSGVLYLYERVLREWRGRQRTHITRVVLHPSRVLEVQFKKDYFKTKAGQYLFLCCPDVSMHQWHPFTITSAPEDDYISVHIRMAGDFTKELARLMGCEADPSVPVAGRMNEGLNRSLPSIMVDGPFGSASEDVFNYEVSVLVGAGIGVTPFASILRSIWYRLYTPSRQTRLTKVYFFWICRDKEAFEWFQSLLSVIEQEDTSHIIEINTFLTGKLKGDEIRNLALNYEVGKEDALTGLRSHTQYGRPNFGQIFGQLCDRHRATDVGVFFCGPKPLGKSLHMHCNQYSQPGEEGTKFHYNKENF